MRRGLVFMVLAALALAVFPGDGQAFGRRGRLIRCRPLCPAPVLYYSSPYCHPHLPPYYRPGVWSSVPHSPYALVPTGGLDTAIPQKVTIRNKQYLIIPDSDRGDHVEDVVDRDIDTIPFAKGVNIPTADRFSGTSRRLAKTTIFNGPVEHFDTLAALLDWLPSNAHMVGLGISHAPTSKRVMEERKNVSVTAYIYAFKKEPDKDYHVILGDAPGTPNQRYMNVEISGIPIAGTDENRDRLWAVRKQFKAAFGLKPNGPGSYFRPNPPVPVKITGSLFWDVDHQKPPYVGPQSHKPKTPWEIHPVSAIEFLD